MPADPLQAVAPTPTAGISAHDPLGSWVEATGGQLADLKKAEEEAKGHRAEAQGYYKDAADEMNRIQTLREADQDRLQGRADALEQGATRLPAPPQAPDEPDVPSRAAQPFLNLGENAGLVQSLNSTLYGLGLLAQMGMGMAKGYPSGALAAYTGALDGWAKGDAVRAEHMWKEYLAGVAKMSREYQRQRDEYQDILDRFGLSRDMLGTQLSLAAAKNGLAKERVLLAAQKPDEFMRVHQLFDGQISALRKQAADISGEIAKAYIAKQQHDTVNAFRQQMLDLKKKEMATADGGLTGGLTPDAQEMAAQQYLRTGQLPPMGMSRYGAQTRAAIINRATELAKTGGLGLDSQTQRTMLAKANQTEMNRIQAQRGPVLAFARTADKNLDVALEMSDKVDRTGVTVFNRWLSGGRKGTGDVDVVRFHAAVVTASTEYARVMSGGSVTSDKAREEASGIISQWYTQEQFRGVADIMRRDMKNRESAYDEQLAVIRESMNALKAPAPGGAGGAKIGAEIDKALGLD